MTKDEAMKLALDFIEKVNKDGWILADFEPQMYSTIAALEEALAQTEQEPVACPDNKQCKHGAWCTETYCQEHCEFFAPPQRKPLTDEEIDILAFDEGGLPNSHLEFARAIEAAHGIKE